MDSKNPLPKVDHGVDVVDDEDGSAEEILQNILPIPKMEKKIVPEHPYCTNWPVTNRKEKNEDI
jgi:hypothetical protein